MTAGEAIEWLEAILEDTLEEDDPRDAKRVDPVLVIASQYEAGGLKKAAEEGIDPRDIVVVRPGDFSNPEAFGGGLIKECKTRDVNLIGQYGWMPKTPVNLIAAYPGRMINQHPGPLDPGYPDFGGRGMYGKRVHCARLNFVRATRTDTWTEATAQRVAPEFDKGAILRKKTIPIMPDDTVESLQQRVLPLEHEVQIECLEDFSENRVSEYWRHNRLVIPGQEGLLAEAKRAATMLYPQG